MRLLVVAIAGATSLLLACGGPPTTAPDVPASASPWHPSPGTTWQWQLTGVIDTSFDVQMYDVDLFETPASTTAALHAAGRVVICYFSAGSYEAWRPDQRDFPEVALGNELVDWPGERWLDVRRADVRTLMAKRLDRAVAAHCDGVEPDNVDGYANDNGLGLTATDQLDYNRFLAREAHVRGLSVGLKNDLDQVAALADDFDWSLNEECHAHRECAALAPFVAAGKAVFHVEYVDASRLDEVCAETVPLGFSTILKKVELDAWRRACSAS
jgi:hypothetical protein